VSMGFIEKFILPKEVDFITALQRQTSATRDIVHDLYDACVRHQPEAFEAIKKDADEARALKNANMKELLDVFITPYDKESIYRIIIQLDWVALSVKHFVIEVEAYEVDSLDAYRNIFEVLKEMVTLLDESFVQLSVKELKTIATTIDLIHDKYDLVVEYCAQAVAELLRQDDCKTIIMHKEIIAQLKEIAKRMHISANTLEDMAIKVV